MGSLPEVHGALRSVYPRRGKQILIDDCVSLNYIQHWLRFYTPGDVFILELSVYSHKSMDTTFSNYVISAYGCDPFFEDHPMTPYECVADKDGIFIALTDYDHMKLLENKYPDDLISKHIAMIPDEFREKGWLSCDEIDEWRSRVPPGGVIRKANAPISWMQWTSIKVAEPPINVSVLVWMANNYYVGYLDEDSHWNFFGVTPDGMQLFTIENDAPFVKAWAELPDPFREGE